MIVAFADDLTGALEVGAKFADCGFRSRIVTELTSVGDQDCDVLVIDTETRHLSADEAFNAVRKTAQRAAALSLTLIFKKTDSTLRGNIEAELRALLSVYPDREFIYAPAYPQLNRTVIAGHLHVSGVPVEMTEFAGDSLNPVRGGNIRQLLAQLPVRVVDGVCDWDLQCAATEVLRSPACTVAIGAAAFAGALAKGLGTEYSSCWRSTRIQRCLIVNGSQHPASTLQMKTAEERRCFDKQWCRFQAELQSADLERARQVGLQVREQLAAGNFDAVIIFGGDTGFGIYEALGRPYLQPIGELLPGVPVARCGDLTLISKAGGFGAPDLLVNLKQILA